jgi:hypothetical protein
MARERTVLGDPFDAKVALASSIREGDKRAKEDVLKMAELLKEGDRKGVNEILHFYYGMLKNLGVSPIWHERHLGLGLFAEEGIEKGERKPYLYFFSDGEYHVPGLIKVQYAGYHSGTLDFGSQGPITSTHLEMSDKEFKRAAFIGFGRILQEINKKRSPRERGVRSRGVDDEDNQKAIEIASTIEEGLSKGGVIELPVYHNPPFLTLELHYGGMAGLNVDIAYLTRKNDLPDYIEEEYGLRWRMDVLDDYRKFLDDFHAGRIEAINCRFDAGPIVNGEVSNVSQDSKTGRIELNGVKIVDWKTKEEASQ